MRILWSLALFLAIPLLPGLALAHQEPAVKRSLAKGVDRAINNGVSALLALQNRDGSWSPSCFQRAPHWDHRDAQTSLVLYTLLKCKLDKDHPAVRHAAEYLLSGTPTKTYALGVQLMALAELDPELHHKRMRKQTTQLLKTQDSLGSGIAAWTYSQVGGQYDLSNTQYAVLGLRAAQKAGVKLPKGFWPETAEAILRFRGPKEEQADSVTQGFAYAPGLHSTSAMTATGVSILRMAQMDSDQGLPSKLAPEVDLAVELGIQWLLNPFQVSENRAGEPFWNFYFLYALERVGSLAEARALGEHIWYRSGVEFLLKCVEPDGTWRGPGQTAGTWPPAPMIAANTCFALLFLKRATVSSGSTLLSTTGHAQEHEDSPVWLRITGGKKRTLWVSGFGFGQEETYSDLDGSTPGLRVTEVRYLLAEEVIGTVEGNPNKGWDGERFAIQHEQPTGGELVFAVEVDVLRPASTLDDGSKPTETLRSFDLPVDAGPEWQEWMGDYATSAARNPLLGIRFTTSASSTFHDRWAPGDAVDGLQFSGWICAPDDPDPTWVLELKKPARVNTLLLSTLERTEANRGDYSHPTQVSILVNKERKARVIELSKDPLHKTEIPLGRSLNLRRLEIRILSKADQTSPHTSGLGEIEAEWRR